MSRLIWVGVGAVGGIYAYRKGEQAVDAVRELGMLGTAQVVAAAAVHSLTALRTADAAQAHPIIVSAPVESPGLRIGGLRITRAEKASPGAPLASPQQPRAAIMDAGVVDITDPAERAVIGRRRGDDAAGRRKAR